MTCRNEILDAIRDLIRGREDQTFSPVEVAKFMRARGSRYRELSIRSLISTGMASPQPGSEGVTLPDLERVKKGRYRLR